MLNAVPSFNNIDFKGGSLSSDGGAILLLHFLKKLNISERFCKIPFDDKRFLPMYSNGAILTQLVARTLQGDEIRDYILYKIRYAGGTDSLIDPAAISAISGYSQGNPRIIDSLMTDALKIGAQQKLSSITSEVILAAADNRVF